MSTPFDASQILRQYDSEMRLRPPNEPGQRFEAIDGLVRSLGRHNTIVYSSLDAIDVDRVVGQQVAYFTALGEDVEWKVYAHDAPANLEHSLASHGFEPDEPETLMVFGLVSGTIDREGAPDVDVRPVRDRDDRRAYVDVTRRAFERDADATSAFEPGLFDPIASTIAFVARVDGRPAAAGRLDLPPDRSFASLWGGGTDPQLRKRGAYRALVAERARVARERGYRYLTVDARETSRPILERLGFLAIGTTTPWTRTASRRAPNAG